MIDTTADVTTPECKKEAARIGVRHPLPFGGDWAWWLPSRFCEKIEADRDRLAAILREIDAECDKFEGITPLYSRWVAIKKLAKEGATAKVTP
jgi:hypothetical protein